MPLILATWKVEIRRITVQGQLGQIVCKTLSQPVTGYGSVCLSSQLLWEAVHSDQAKSETLSQKITRAKRAGDMAQVVKHEYKPQSLQKKKKKEKSLKPAWAT
jgi:hypothetical protein